MADVDWSRLARRICGQLVLQSDPKFASQVAGLVWNGLKPERSPGAIAQCLNEGDVRQCVLFARDNGLKIVVRGGGHNWNGATVRDGVLVIDLSRLNEVHINAAHQTAIIQPVVTNERMVAALESRNLAFQVGNCPTVPASGYLLGGGLGLNSQKWGAGCHAVEAVEIVNARGETIVADENHNADLYWAARGGAQGFPGVVVRYHLKVHRKPRAVHQATCVYRLEESRQFIEWLSKFVLDLPPAVQSNTLITTAFGADPEGDRWDDLPASLREALVFLFGIDQSVNESGSHTAWLTYVAAAFADSDDEARELLAPFEKWPAGPPPVFWLSPIPSSFWILNAFTGLLFRHGRQYVADYHWVDVSLADIVERVTPEFEKPRTADSFVLVTSYQTPLAQMAPPGSTCFSMSSQNLVGIYGIGDHPDDVRFNKDWVAKLRTLIEPNSLGLYIGEADLDVAPGRAAKAYSPESWAKLRELKQKYDPDNLFAWFLNDQPPS